MHSLLEWVGKNATVLAVLLTAGVGVLVLCCLECSNCGCREKDEIFNRHEV